MCAVHNWVVLLLSCQLEKYMCGCISEWMCVFVYENVYIEKAENTYRALGNEKRVRAKEKNNQQPKPN